MNEMLDLLLQLANDMKVVKAYILTLPKQKRDGLKETWIDGQEVIQALHLSKRTLQTLRDSGTLPYSRIKGKFYYKVTDVEHLLETNYSASKPKTHEPE